MRKAAYFLIVVIGLLQIAGYCFRSPSIRGLGQALSSSPLPIVFTEVKGVETFAADFFIGFTDSTGAYKEVVITPEMYSKLKGPYNRRNVYGAAISYGPVLPEKIWKSVLNYGVCNKTLLTELGVPHNGTNYVVRIKSRTEGRIGQTWELHTNCQ
ncbi:MAG: hypothetical protein RL007_98 [Bacteroidota bacterium]|jgi:hypothetical protein